MEKLVLEPVIQGGFLGMCAVLLVMLFWMVKRLLGLLETHAGIIAANTKAMSEQSKAAAEHTRLVGELLCLTRSMHDKLLARPCIARGDRL